MLTKIYTSQTSKTGSLISLGAWEEWGFGCLGVRAGFGMIIWDAISSGIRDPRILAYTRTLLTFYAGNYNKFMKYTVK